MPFASMMQLRLPSDSRAKLDRAAADCTREKGTRMPLEPFRGPQGNYSLWGRYSRGGVLWGRYSGVGTQAGVLWGRYSACLLLP